MLVVHVSVILEPPLFSPIPEIPTETHVTTPPPPPSVTTSTPVLQQQTTPIPTPPITTVAQTATTVPNPHPVIVQRVSTLEKYVQELKHVNHSTEIRASIRSHVPSVVNEFLGSSLGDALQNVLQKHTEECRQEFSQIEVLKIREIKKEHAKKQKKTQYSIKSSDKADLMSMIRKLLFFIL
ncbi:hypothetical protein Tco_0597374 [Tanacetum coccineum]